MASIYKHGKAWRAQIDRDGVRASKNFPTKVMAERWATEMEADILAGRRGQFPRKTLADACDRYTREVSPTKRGERFETLRLLALCRDFPELGSKVLSEVTTADLASWRDARLRKVSAASVTRDINLISHLFTKARKEWKWCGASPTTDLERPGESTARTRRVSRTEIKRICRWLGYRSRKPETKSQEVAVAFLIALRTGMRAGEILQLDRSTVDGVRRVATIKDHKTQHITKAPREVPLSKAAMRLLSVLGPDGFTVGSASLSTLFRKATAALLIKDLHFHDSRAESLTRWARKVDVMTLARISGHKDLALLLRVYYRETAADIAARLG